MNVWGFGPFFATQLLASDGCPPIVARIAAEHRNFYEVWSEKTKGPAQLPGRFRAGAGDLPCVGDWVTLTSHPTIDHPALIERVLARRTVFTRGAAGRATRVQTVAANVDVVFAVCGLDNDYSPNRMERYVARIWASGAQPCVVLNKADLAGGAAPCAAEIARRCPGVAVFVTSALHGDGIEPLRRCIRAGETAAFVGSSGAGKSSLINALIGEEKMAIGEVRHKDDTGCHTTTHRQLVELPEGGLLLDTPGMRELQLVDDEGLDAVFEDIAELAAQCRFRDCRHGTEPGCAVKSAVDAGTIAAERLENYRKLEREAEAGERRRDARLRREDERAWGRLTNQGSRARQLKGYPD